MRSLFTVHGGEFLVGQHIEAAFKEKSVWIPTKDVGIDLLVANTGYTRVMTLQVKFSRDFLPAMKLKPSVLKELRSCTWFTVTREKLKKSPARLWVFVLLGFEAMTYDYIVIEPTILLDRLDQISQYKHEERNSRPCQIYIWVTQHERAWLTRGLKKAEQESIAKETFESPSRDLTHYLNNWAVIEEL